MNCSEGWMHRRLTRQKVQIMGGTLSKVQPLRTRCGISFAIAAFVLQGCASITPERFEASKASLSDTQVCEAFADSLKISGTSYYLSARAERNRRGLTEQACEALLAEKSRNIGFAVAAVAAVALVAVAAKGGGGGAGSAYAPGYPTAQTDYSWQWDQFYNAQSQLIWTCRGEQTGQFAALSKCQGKAQLDWRWPGLTAPF